MKTKNANNVSGILCRSINGKYFLRVYNDGKTSFKDYDLKHSDLKITITDDDATFYENEDGTNLYLDHNKQTLGN